ncbi:NUDIX hydrolase [Streptomyces sp. NPDC059816]|uniref:NUDIX hydrolase n=1 Tax=Streptomyces sp. NPDC059816 TaxID=3346960 RepID=UPI0036588C59
MALENDLSRTRKCAGNVGAYEWCGRPLRPLGTPGAAQAVAEETGCDAVVERLLGVDSRVIPPAERPSPGLPEHQNVGVFYQVRITGGRLRPEPNGETAESVWTPLPRVADLRRSSLVDIGLALARTLPATGHVAAVPIGGLIRH